MSWLKDCSVVLHNTQWEPSLLAFWVNSAGDVEILVNLSHNGKIRVIALSKFLQENGLEVAVPS